VTTETQGSSTQWVSQITQNKVPDLRGMTLRDALHLLENRGFRVRFEGYGKVIRSIRFRRENRCRIRAKSR
jgi:cell division protein FtsI (penicillin-binding protein 3)